jgi:feruloyl-CoA synthase
MFAKDPVYDSTPLVHEDPFAPVDIVTSSDSDGSLVIRNKIELPEYRSLIEAFRGYSENRPRSAFIAERNEGGGWRVCTYAEMRIRANEIAGNLLALGCSHDRPLMLVGPNSIVQAALLLGAMRVGIPVAPVSVGSVLHDQDFGRLTYLIDLVRPGAFFVDDSLSAGPALAVIRSKVEHVFGEVHVADGLPSLAELPSVGAEHIRAAEDAVTPDTIAKLLFTSGSTGRPKSVINTHRMLSSNQAGALQVWPFLRREPPTLVDWLPWSHTMAGNFTFGFVLANGGTLYIDDGRPTPKLIKTTVENLKSIQPTCYFNVPMGFESLLTEFEEDAATCRTFFSRLRFMMCAGASLPQKTRDRLIALGRDASGRTVPMVGGWGATETSPTSTLLYFETPQSCNVGLPIPGTSIKLAPVQDKLEIRVKGPNVTPGYWRNREATAAAFDEQGWYCSGDAARLIDPDDPARGIAFDGRIAENFKLSSGTWVDVDSLRIAVVDACRPLIRDAVVTGHDRSEIGLLVFPNLDACRMHAPGGANDAEVLRHAGVYAALRERLSKLNGFSKGSSKRIARFLIQTVPPRAEALEITEKGFLSQRVILQLRATEVIQLYENDDYCI